MRNTVAWDVSLCSLVKLYPRFGETPFFVLIPEPDCTNYIVNVVRTSTFTCLKVCTSALNRPQIQILLLLCVCVCVCVCVVCVCVCGVCVCVWCVCVCVCVCVTFDKTIRNFFEECFQKYTILLH
jgi:hypothetical protein